MQCPKCQYENPEDMQFCGRCGSKLQNLCPECEFANPPEFQFCGKCGAKLTQEAPPSVTLPKLEDMQKQLQSRIPQSLADRLFAGAEQMQGEYRLVTAIFADVVGSSEMAREMPLEQYVGTMNDCFKMMVDTISIEYEGSINRFIGDCVLAFFGAPITHENDAERAILAALDIRDGLKELNLDVSIGINTGMTYVGEMGSDLYFERSAWGPDVDFAKRLQEAAKPGQIWVGASTYRLTSRMSEPSKVGKKLREYGKELRDAGLNQPLLKSVGHPEDFPRREFEDSFKSGSLSPPWEWLDPENRFSYALCHDPDRIDILASRESALGFGAPRLSQLITGDFSELKSFSNG